MPTSASRLNRAAQISRRPLAILFPIDKTWNESEFRGASIADADLPNWEVIHEIFWFEHSPSGVAGGIIRRVCADYDFDALRAAVEKHKDVNVALADGFIPDPAGHCVSAEAEGLPPEGGAMGMNYLNPEKLQITGDTPRVDGMSTYTDYMAPAILLYEPQEDGSLELVGIENLVFEKAWMEAGNSGPPVLNGREWDHMSDNPDTDADEAHGFMPHFDQHVWLFRENPAGDLMPFNPRVTCEHHMGH